MLCKLSSVLTGLRSPLLAAVFGVEQRAALADDPTLPRVNQCYGAQIGRGIGSLRAPPVAAVFGGENRPNSAPTAQP